MKISVVMPAYNSAAFIRSAIESILGQTFGEFEFVIVDDGSKDSTLQIVDEYKERDERIVIVKDQHGGVSAALNTGIAKSCHPWIAIMHSDDVARPERFARQVAAIADFPEATVIGSYAYHINSTGRVLGISRTGPTTTDEFLALRARGEITTVIHPTAILRRNIFEQVGGYDSWFDGAEEMELFSRMANYGPIIALPDPLLSYRIHSTSITTQHFLRMRTLTRYVRARQKWKCGSEKTLTFERYCADYRKKPALFRLRQWMDDRSQYYYRKGGLMYADRKMAGFLLFFLK